MRLAAEAFTMQALVKYHGLKNWELRLPFHDSISVNTTSMKTEASMTDERKGGVFQNGVPNDSANERLKAVVDRLAPGRSVKEFRIDSRNLPPGNAKGIGYSSSAGAALTLLCQKLLKKDSPDSRELSRVARLFAASASRSLTGGFSRLYAGRGDMDTYSEKFADSKDMDLRMVIAPLSSPVKTEEVHREVMSSPFFKARVKSAQKRCDQMEKAIVKNDIDALGVLAEKDTMELHALTMTGESRMMIMSEDSFRLISKVRQLRDEGIRAYFSMQTGPSVFINTTERDESRVLAAVTKMGYKAYLSGVGEGARLVSPRGG